MLVTPGSEWVKCLIYSRKQCSDPSQGSNLQRSLDQKSMVLAIRTLTAL